MIRNIMLTLLTTSFIVIPCFAADPTPFPIMLYGPCMTSGSITCPLTATPTLRGYCIDCCLGYKNDLKLSNEQESRLKALRMSYVSDIKVVRANIINLENELDKLYASDKLDYKAISFKVSEIIKAQDGLNSTYYETMHRTCDILTEGQRDKFRSLVAGLAGH